MIPITLKFITRNRIISVIMSGPSIGIEAGRQTGSGLDSWSD